MAAEMKPSSVVITGAGQPIGRAAAEHFTAQGWRVLALDGVDLADAGALETACAELLASLPDGLQALVNAAAFETDKPLAEISLEDWDRIQAVNLRAPFLVAKGLYPALKPAQGAVVNLPPAEATAQGGIQALTRSMAIEFAPDGVRANAVLIGGAAKSLLGQPPTPEDIARAIYFLADAGQSGSITGQAIVVDGGASAQLGTE